MDAIINWISKRLAEHTSRRGFFSTMEKALLGMAAIAAGQDFSACSSTPTQPAEALDLLECCDRRNIPCSTGTVCPSGSSLGYAWLCHTHDGSHYQCADCYDSSDDYVCSYTLKVN